MGVFYVTYVILWLVVLILTTMTLLLYRQFGLMLMPGRAKTNLEGLDLGSSLPALSLRSPAGDPIDISWRVDTSAGLGTLLLLANRNCPICERLWRAVGEIAAAWPDVRCVWLEDGLDPTRGERPARWMFACSGEVSFAKPLEVSVSPFAYVLNRTGRVANKGLVNSVTDISSMLLGAFAPEGAQWTIPNDGSILTQEQLRPLASSATV